MRYRIRTVVLISLIMVASSAMAGNIEDAKKYYAQAIEEVEDGNRRIALLDRSIQEYQTYQAYALKGRTLQVLGRCEEAIRSFSEALNLATSDELKMVAHGRSAECYLDIGQGLDAANTMKVALEYQRQGKLQRKPWMDEGIEKITIFNLSLIHI